MVHLTNKSSNAKTGPIPVSTSSKNTCPPSCAFYHARNGECYAEGGPLLLHWNAVSANQRGIDWAAFCESIQALPAGQLWRHNQAGDLPGNGELINGRMLRRLVKANTGKRGFTYTHKRPQLGNNLAHIRHANDNGFVVNLSANNLDEADMFKQHYPDLPVVSVLAQDESRRSYKTRAGNTVVVCPATYMDTNCAKCALCSRKDRSAIVGFPAHGAKAKAISNKIQSKG